MAEPRLVSNKWEIIRVIGHGGMGSVYEVRHTTLEIRRALKTLHRHLADDPDIVKRFHREGRNEARLEHPNIVRVYDFDTDPDFGAYLTMEVVEGLDLKQVMQQGPVPFHEVLRIGCEVAAALEYAHSAVPPVVHRDIKPANILISNKTGTAKVTDFGIAKELADRETGVTGTQGFIGTIRYAAPEQVRDDVKIDARCDLYSLGVMLYEMYSGKIFLEGEKPADIYRRTMVDLDWQPPMVYASPPPEEFAEVIRWCLQRRREDRVPSARELGKCLRVCIETMEAHGEYHPAVGSGEPPAATPDLAALPEPFVETSVTAATVVALVVEEESTTIVGLRAKIMRFRQDVDREAESFRRLYAEAAQSDVPLGGVPAPDDFSHQFTQLDEEVDVAVDSRDRERLAHVFSRCERLREQFVVGTRELRSRLADAIATAVANLRAAWQTLAEAGGAAVLPEAQASFEALMERARAGVDAADWQSAREVLAQARTLFEQTRAALTEQAEGRVEQLLQQAAAVVAELPRYLAADATPAVDMHAVQSAVNADLAAGRADAAVRRAEDAVEEARGELDRRRLEAQDVVERQRRAAEGALESLDSGHAERIAPDEFRRAVAALESAREADKQDQLSAAATHYREALELLERLDARITEEHAARIAVLNTRVVELMQEAGRSPEVVTGAARQRAEALVREHARSGSTTAIEALETARQLLEDVLAEVPEYVVAQAAAEAASAAEQRVRSLDPSRTQLEAIAAQQASASGTLANRRWGDAATAYRDAERTCVDLEQQLRAEHEAAHLAERAATACADAIERLDTDGAQTVAAGDLAAATQLDAGARALQQQHEWPAAAAAFDAATAAFTALQERVQRELAPQLTAATDALRRALASASEAPAAVVGPARQRAEAALAATASAKPSVAVATAHAALAALDQALTEAAEYQQATGQRTAAETLQARVAQLGLGRRELRPIDRLATDAAAAFDRREWTRARETYAQLHQQLESLERHAAQGQRLAAARSVATEARAAVDVTTARECAADTLGEAEQAFTTAARAEQAGDSERGAAQYERAQALYARTRELVAAEYARRLDGERTQLRDLLERTAGAPVDVVGPARQQAEAVFTNPPTDFATAWSAAVDAQANLARALADVPTFNNAREQQTAAQVVLERVRSQQPTRARVAPAERAMQNAAAAFTERQWARAAEAFHNAHEQLLALEHTLQIEGLRARAEAARIATEAARAHLDIPTAEQCAVEQMRAATTAIAAAAEAEGTGNYERAATQYADARAAYDSAAELVAREYQRRLAEIRETLERTLHEAANLPPEVVADARRAAEVALAAPTTNAREAVALLETAHAALATAQQAVPAFLAAREQQQHATDVQTRVEALRPRPRRAQLKAAQALVKDAAAAAQRRDWTVVRDGYAQAADAFTRLEQAAREQPTPPSRRTRLVPIVVVIALVAVALVWQLLPRTKPAPLPPQTTKPVEQQPESKPAPQPPPVEPWSIASAKPADDLVTGKENEPLSFTILPAGGAAGTTAKVEWSLDNAPVQADGTAWTYKPGFDAAGSHTVIAKIDGGERPDQSRTWKVQVENVNRPPTLVKVLPDPKTTIDAKVGDSVVLKAEATDVDRDDRLTYRWTIDGKPAGTDAPQLNVKVASNHAVALTVSDGKDSVEATWRIAALAPLVVDFSPKQLDTLRFKSSEEFKLLPARDLSLADLSFTWTLDGRKVSDRSTFTLEATDGALVRATPVKITATAADKQGRSFSHDWKLTVVPPAPEIQSAAPPTDKPIEAESGQSLALQVAAAPTVGNQQLTYLFGVDGQPAVRTGKPQFEFRVADESEHRVTARVEDNYRQASRQDATWRIQAGGIVSRAQKWVAAFQEARRSSDAEKEGRLRDLSATEVSRLKDAYSKQKDLQVTFTAPQVEKLAGNRALVTFGMTQAFETTDGQPMSGHLACQFTLMFGDGRLHEERQPQGPCVPAR